MDTIEIVVYLSIAVLIGGLLLTATAQMTNKDVLDKVKGLFSQEEKGFSQVTKDTLPGFLFSVWKDCGLGSKDHTVAFTYTGEPISEEGIFSEVKRLRLCNSLSNKLYDCGSRIDLTLSGASIAEGVYEARCDASINQLVVQ